MAVNTSVVLCVARGQLRILGHKLAFSKDEGQFCSVRFVPRKNTPFLLRSPEEIAVLKRLSHPNVVNYHECLTDPDRGGYYVIFVCIARGFLTVDHNLFSEKSQKDNFSVNRLSNAAHFEVKSGIMFTLVEDMNKSYVVDRGSKFNENTAEPSQISKQHKLPSTQR